LHTRARGRRGWWQGDRRRRRSGRAQVGVATKTRTRSKKPSQYKVLMLNDDYTPMEFVVMCLKALLPHGPRAGDAGHAPLSPERRRGVRRLPLRVAETKVNQVMDFARQNQHPLQCTLEKA
jgi:ATP-dependent Clp protease adaptor protein ClpS